MGMSLPTLAMPNLSNPGGEAAENWIPLIANDISILNKTGDDIGGGGTNGGDYYFLRSKYNATYDYVQQIYVFGQKANYLNVGRLIPIATANTRDAVRAAYLANAEYINSLSDSHCPMSINGMNMGGGHAADVAVSFTCDAAHGLGDADVGTVFVANSINWTLIRVDSTTIVWFMAEKPTSTESVWAFYGASDLTGTAVRASDSKTLTRSGTSVSNQQLIKGVTGEYINYSMIKKTNTLTDIALTTIPKNTLTSSKMVIMTEVIWLLNPRDALAYVTANATHLTSNPDYRLGSTNPYAIQTNVWRFTDYGCVTIDTTYLFNKIPANTHLLMGAWNGKIYGGNKYLTTNIKWFMPDVTGNIASTYINNELNTIPTTSVKAFTSTDFVDATYPPNRVIEVGMNTIPESADAFGFSPLMRQSIPTQRMVNAANALFTVVAGKIVNPRFRTYSVPISIGETYSCLMYDKVSDPRIAGGSCTSLYWVNEQNYALLYIDYHAEVTAEEINLPVEFTGKNYEVIRSSPDVTTISDTMAVSGTLPTLSITTGGTAHSYAILKVHN